ncbi:hypothetical protein DPEC_G00206880, partial [Dallia pectoralis]
PASHSPIHSHSYTDDRIYHARRLQARQEQLGLGVLLMDTSTISQEEPGIEPPTFRLIDNRLNPLSHCRPSKNIS